MQHSTHKSGGKRARKRRRGQVIFEAALIVLGLLMLSMGLLQFGIIYYTTSALTNMTRETARYAAITARDTNSVAELKSKVVTRLKEAAANTSIRPEEIKEENVVLTSLNGNPVVQDSGSRPEIGTPVTLTLKYNMTSRFFLPKVMFRWLDNGGWDPYQVSSTSVIE